MGVPYEAARDEWAKRKVVAYRKSCHEMGHPEFFELASAYGTQPKPKPMPVVEAKDVTIVDIDIDPGGSTQIGDMTWDHENPSIEIIYTIPGILGRWGHDKLTCNVELDFGELVKEIVEIAEELAASFVCLPNQ